MGMADSYSWAIQTVDGEIIKKRNKDGSLKKWQDIDKDKIIRFSFVPMLPLLPQHEIFIDIMRGNKFIKYFGRGFLKQKNRFKLSDYVFCVITEKFRVYVNHMGAMTITPKDYEMKL